jgi:hypothetical protein
MTRHLRGSSLPLVALLLLTALAGCGGDDNGNEEADRRARPVAGTFVSKVRGSEAFVSVVAAPRAKGEDQRAITVFACDARRLCDVFSATAAANDFTAKAAGDGGEAKGKLTAKAATGTIEPPEGKALDYKAAQATATSGLYDLKLSRNGRLSGASAAGVALKGNVELPPPGSGTIRLADGKRLKFDVVAGASDAARLRPGQVRLIVLPDRQLRGAGRSRGGGGDAFSVRSR